MVQRLGRVTALGGHAFSAFGEQPAHSVLETAVRERVS